MNKFQKIAALSALTLTLLAPGLAAAEDMKDMTMIDYSKVKVMTKNGMELVPVRDMAVMLGYTVDWDQKNKSVMLTYGKMMKETMTDDKTIGDKMMDKSDTATGGTMTDTSDPSMSGKMMDKMKDMTYTVKITLGKTKFMVGMSEKMLAYAPVMIDGKTYVTKDFIEMYLASPSMMK